MGIVYAEVELLNGADVVDQRRKGRGGNGRVRSVRVRAMADSGATLLSINEAVRAQLGLEPIDYQLGELADGTRLRLPLVGPIEVRFQGRRTMVEALVLPAEQEVLLGAIPMEAMDVVVDPRRRRLVPNPDHLNGPETRLK